MPVRVLLLQGGRFRARRRWLIWEFQAFSSRRVQTLPARGKLVATEKSETQSAFSIRGVESTLCIGVIGEDAFNASLIASFTNNTLYSALLNRNRS